MPTDNEFKAWGQKLRETHPEMFDTARSDRKTARKKWDPIFMRVYGIRPWEMGQYTISEYAALVDDLERHGLGGI